MNRNNVIENDDQSDFLRLVLSSNCPVARSTAGGRRGGALPLRAVRPQGRATPRRTHANPYE